MLVVQIIYVYDPSHDMCLVWLLGSHVLVYALDDGCDGRVCALHSIPTYKYTYQHIQAVKR